MLKKLSFGLPAITFITLILLLGLSLNISPLLRGPAPYYPDWQWPYQFTNTLNRIWFPVGVLALIFYTAFRFENLKKELTNKKIILLFIFLILLGFFLQISLLYYSRFGINIIVERMINPTLSGYFSASMKVGSLQQFLHDFNQNVPNYPMYARFHPPASTLFFALTTAIVKPFTNFFPVIIHSTPTHPDIAKIWSSLADYQKVSAVFSGLFVILFTYFTLIPLYYCARLLYGFKAALRSILVFLLIPNILMFTPLNDSFFPFFTCSFLLAFLYGIKNRSYILMFLSGFIFSLSLSFNLTFFAIGLLLFFVLLFHNDKKKFTYSLKAKLFLSFLAGIVVIPIFVFLQFGLNPIQMGIQIMSYHEGGQAKRSYFTWFFYDVYDFFLFLGIPLGLLYGKMVYQLILESIGKKFNKIKVDSFSISLVLFFLILDVSGSVRGEVGRIWIPFVPLFILVIVNFITNKFVLGKIKYLELILLLMLQVLVFQTFIVALW